MLRAVVYNMTHEIEKIEADKKVEDGKAKVESAVVAGDMA